MHGLLPGGLNIDEMASGEKMLEHPVAPSFAPDKLEGAKAVAGENNALSSLQFELDALINEQRLAEEMLAVQQLEIEQAEMDLTLGHLQEEASKREAEKSLLNSTIPAGSSVAPSHLA